MRRGMLAGTRVNSSGDSDDVIGTDDARSRGSVGVISARDVLEEFFQGNVLALRETA